MRQALNENPKVQVAVVAVLLLVAGLFLMMNMGGGGGGEPAAPGTGAAPVPATAPPSTAGTTAEAGSATAAPTTAVASTPLGPKPPAAVSAAYRSGDTVVLLVVEEDGIEDRFVRTSVEALKGDSTLSITVVPVAEIGRYARLTQGVNVSRAPAMVVMQPKRLSQGVPTAQVYYGYRSAESVKQLVRDASFEGQPASYGPR